MMMNGYMLGAPAGPQWVITPADRGNYERSFQNVGPVSGKITGEQARNFFFKTGLPKEMLAHIWGLSDLDGDGAMTFEEFCIAMKLINLRLGGAEIPRMLPDSLRQSATSKGAPAGGVGMGMGMGMGMSPGMGAGPGPSPMGGLGMGPGLPPIAQQDRLRYQQQFNAYDKNRTGLITGQQARQIFSDPRLSQPVLAQIWALSDVDQDGNLNQGEFVLAQHLLACAKQGHQMPQTLPPSLLPAKAGQQTSGVMDSEDARRANYRAGQEVLEAKRKALEAEERRAREELDRKRAMEEAARMATQERMMQEQERMRQMQAEEMRRQMEMQMEQQRRMAEQMEAQRLLMEEEQRRQNAMRQEILASREQMAQKANAATLKLTQLSANQDRLESRKVQLQNMLLQMHRDTEAAAQATTQLTATHAAKSLEVQKLQTEYQSLEALLQQVQADRNQLSQKLIQIHQMKANVAQGAQAAKSQAEAASKGFETINRLQKALDDNLSSITERKMQLQELQSQLQSLTNELQANRAQKQQQPKQPSAVVSDQYTPSRAPPTAFWADPFAAPGAPAPAPAPAPSPMRSESRSQIPKASESWRRRAISKTATRTKSKRLSSVDSFGQAGGEDGDWAAFARRSSTTASTDDPFAPMPSGSSTPQAILPTVGAAAGVSSAAQARLARRQSRTGGNTPTGSRVLDSSVDWVAVGASIPPATEKANTPNHMSASQFQLPPFPGSTDSAKPTRPPPPSSVDGMPTRPPPPSASYDDTPTRPPPPGSGQPTRPPPPISMDGMPIRPPPPGAFGGSGEIPTRPPPPGSDTPTRPPPPGGVSAVPPPPPAKPMEEFVAAYDFVGEKEGDLTFMTGDYIYVSEKSDDGWWFGECNGREGWFPSTYVESDGAGGGGALPPPPPLSSTSSPAIPTKPDPHSATAHAAAAGEVHVAVYTYTGEADGDLAFQEGDRITVLEKSDDGWWRGESGGRQGWFPSNYVEPEPEPAGAKLGASTLDLPPPPATNNSTEFAHQAAVSASEWVTALHPYQATRDDELTFEEGAVFELVAKDDEWWQGTFKGKTGWFPASYVQLNSAPPMGSTDASGGSNPFGTDPMAGDDRRDTSPTQPGAKTKVIAKVMEDYTAADDSQLSLKRGAMVEVTAMDNDDWWEGLISIKGKGKQTGWFPASHVQLIKAKDAQSRPQQQQGDSIGATATALYTFQATKDDELSFNEGDVITLLEKDDGGWWKGELGGDTGYFPVSYVQLNN